jgi:phage/plasmid-like protein (TIGR03299 family)
MPANVGEMFYYDSIPWHKLGIEVKEPVTMEEALTVGGLRWRVEDVPIQTCDDPPTPTDKRVALVRTDRPAGDGRRVLGIVHKGFKPLQNEDGARLFDAIFGQGKHVYHTGGYLGNGEVVWLLAKIPRTLTIGKRDIVEPYALFANSHDGSQAFTISLTTIRVVCQNTLNIALSQKGVGAKFRRSHQGSFSEHAEAAREFWGNAMKQLDEITGEFTRLSLIRCRDDQCRDLLERLLPLPRKPRNIERHPGLKKAYETRCQDILKARESITKLRMQGKGMEMETAAGTFWGVLGAITEYIDHHKEIEGSRVSYALLGDGMDLKMRAFRMIQEEAAKAA